jgi:hypothetical protein
MEINSLSLDSFIQNYNLFAAKPDVSKIQDPLVKAQAMFINQASDAYRRQALELATEISHTKQYVKIESKFKIAQGKLDDVSAKILDAREKGKDFVAMKLMPKFNQTREVVRSLDSQRTELSKPLHQVVDQFKAEAHEIGAYIAELHAKKAGESEA